MKGLSQIFSSQFYQKLATLGLLACPLLTLPLSTSASSTSGQVDIQPTGDKKAKTQQEIDNLNLKIRTAQERLAQLNKLASTNELALAQAQKKLSENQRHQRQLETAFDTLQSQIKQTDDDIEKAQSSLDQQKQWITEQLQDTYKHGQDNALKLVFSGQSPTDTARLLKYHTALHAERQIRMDKIMRQQNHLSGLKSQQLTAHKQLKTKQNELALVTQQQKSLKTKFESSQQTVQKSKKTTFISLKDMQARTQMLENLLQEMIAQEEISKVNQESDFSRLKGKLTIPMQGKLNNTYKTTKSDGSGQWRGVWIQPKDQAPTEVLSVADGHVVFADWLLGYGLLTIIDHGHGYFSLYGHTHTLLRQPGDWVTALTPIAVVKPKMFDSQDIKGLYFEIRENSQALNPGQWLANAK